MPAKKKGQDIYVEQIKQEHLDAAKRLVDKHTTLIGFRTAYRKAVSVYALAVFTPERYDQINWEDEHQDYASFEKLTLKAA